MGNASSAIQDSSRKQMMSAWVITGVIMGSLVVAACIVGIYACCSSYRKTRREEARLERPQGRMPGAQAIEEATMTYQTLARENMQLSDALATACCCYCPEQQQQHCCGCGCSHHHHHHQ